MWFSSVLFSSILIPYLLQEAQGGIDPLTLFKAYNTKTGSSVRLRMSGPRSFSKLHNREGIWIWVFPLLAGRTNHYTTQVLIWVLSHYFKYLDVFRSLWGTLLVPAGSLGREGSPLYWFHYIMYFDSQSTRQLPNGGCSKLLPLAALSTQCIHMHVLPCKLTDCLHSSAWWTNAYD